MAMSRCHLFCYLACITLFALYTVYSSFVCNLSEVDRDEIDLQTVLVRGNKTKVFEKWRKCAERNWLRIKSPAAFWANFESGSEKCDWESDAVEELGIVTTRNKDDTKHFILPKDNATETTFITLGIGKDIAAELNYERKMKKLGKLVTFYGADPISTWNEDLYSTLGRYFPFAVGMKSGTSTASVLIDKKYVSKTVEYKDVLSFIKQDLNIERIDNLWIDAEFAEYEMFPIFEKDGLLDKNNIVVCQVNLEIHLNQFFNLDQNPEFQKKFMQFVVKTVEDGKYGILRATDAHHMRIFMFNFDSDYCRKRF